MASGRPFQNPRANCCLTQGGTVSCKEEHDRSTMTIPMFNAINDGREAKPSMPSILLPLRFNISNRVLTKHVSQPRKR